MAKSPDHCSVYVQVFMVFIVAVAALYIIVLLMLNAPQAAAFIGRLVPVLQKTGTANIAFTCVRCLIPFVGATIISLFAYRYFLRQARARIKL